MPKCPDIGQNSNVDIFDFQISCQSHVKENFNNSRTSDDINMNLGPVTNLTKETRERQKKLTMMSCQQIVTSLSFFQFMANLEQSRSQIPEAQSVKVLFLLIITFHLTETEKRTKKCLTTLILLL